MTSGSTGAPRATLTTESVLVSDSANADAGDGDSSRRHPGRGHSAVACVRARQSAGAGADSGLRARHARRVRAASAAGRCAACRRARLPGRAVHVRSLREEPAGRRLAADADAPDQRRRADRAARWSTSSGRSSASRFTRSTARAKPAASRSTTPMRPADEGMVGTPLPGVTVSADSARRMRRRGAAASTSAGQR